MRNHHYWGLGCFTLITMITLTASTAAASRVRPVLPPPFNPSRTTSTTAVFSPTTLTQTIQRYPDLARLISSGSPLSPATATVQPGLQATLTRNLHNGALVTSPNMIPQGMALAGRYRLITAYDATGQTQSVIYVQNRHTNRLENTILLRGKPHVGGIAYDPRHRRIWLCSHRRNHGIIVSLPLATVRHFNPLTMRAVHYQQRWLLPNLSNASMLTYHHQALYVGQFKSGQPTLMARFPLNAAGHPGAAVQTADSNAPYTYRLQRAISDWQGNLPANLQGITFYRQYALCSQSYGQHASKLVVLKMAAASAVPSPSVMVTYRLPPQLEQITVHGHRLHLLYETGAAAYRQQQPDAIDRVLTINLRRLLD
ncbi:hypothetical protein N692_05935 [Lactiplantibacillus plantarum EGD-AQ4]|nr:hypothetical protein N692_05935 [Lactiplantibacillus plantarum EGD-AQ4]